MEFIRDRDGNPIRRSQNQAGIRRFVRERGSPAIRQIVVGEIRNHEGKMFIVFENGYSYETNFASFAVLCGWVLRWRSAYGAPIRVNDVDAGVLGRNNRELVKYAYPPVK